MKNWIAMICFAAAMAGLAACNDMRDVEHETTWIDGIEAKKILILNEGLFNMNNSTMTLYDVTQKKMDFDLFRTVNKRGLGDTGNDMKLHGGRIYVVVNVSSRVEVIDSADYKSVGSIDLFDERGVARQPRYIEFYNDKAFVSCFDGYVVRIDLATLKVDAVVKVGRNPDQLCIANGKLYVSNSGGLDYPDYDETVSVVDMGSMRELKKITVGKNPGSIVADSEGDVYVVARGDYGDNGYEFMKIDTEIDEVVKRFTDIQPLSMTIVDDMAYMYSVDYSGQEYWVKKFDCKRDIVVDEKFLKDGPEIQTLYGITVDSHTGNVYVTDAKGYVMWGDVACYDHDGNWKYTIEGVGLNPNHVIVQ